MSGKRFQNRNGNEPLGPLHVGLISRSEIANVFCLFGFGGCSEAHRCRQREENAQHRGQLEKDAPGEQEERAVERMPDVFAYKPLVTSVVVFSNANIGASLRASSGLPVLRKS